VVWLAPRVPGDSVRPRRLSGVVVRPLNFTVRQRGGRGATCARANARYRSEASRRSDVSAETCPYAPSE